MMMSLRCRNDNRAALSCGVRLVLLRRCLKSSLLTSLRLVDVIVQGGKLSCELKGLCIIEDYRRIAATIHQLNADIYDFLSCLERDKLAALTRSTPVYNAVGTQALPSKLVVTIPDDLPLDEHEKSVLAKGLNYIPTATRTDEYTTRADCEKFFRRMRLQAHFSSEQETRVTDTSQNVPSEDFDFASLKPKTSRWTPPPGKFKQRLKRTSLHKREPPCYHYGNAMTSS